MQYHRILVVFGCGQGMHTPLRATPRHAAGCALRAADLLILGCKGRVRRRGVRSGGGGGGGGRSGRRHHSDTTTLNIQAPSLCAEQAGRKMPGGGLFRRKVFEIQMPHYEGGGPSPVSALVERWVCLIGVNRGGDVCAHESLP